MAFHQAQCLFDGMRDKMTTRLHEAARDVSTVKSEAGEIVNKSTEILSKVIFAERGYHHAKALATQKKHAKQLSLQQRDFDVVVNDMKRTSKCIAKNADVVLEQQAAIIKTLEGKVASAELSVDFMRHQLEE